MRRRLAILLTMAAICLAPGCSTYDGIRFPLGTVCTIEDVHPNGRSMFVVCIVPLPAGGEALDAA